MYQPLQYFSNRTWQHKFDIMQSSSENYSSNINHDAYVFVPFMLQKWIFQWIPNTINPYLTICIKSDARYKRADNARKRENVIDKIVWYLYFSLYELFAISYY